MSYSILEEIIPKDYSDFPVVDLENVKGGLHYCDYVKSESEEYNLYTINKKIEELIPSKRRTIGMLCYVLGTLCYYQYIGEAEITEDTPEEDLPWQVMRIDREDLRGMQVTLYKLQDSSESSCEAPTGKCMIDSEEYAYTYEGSDGWSKSVDFDSNKVIWMATCHMYLSNNMHSEWVMARLTGNKGEDGDGVNYIYTRSLNPEKPSFSVVEMLKLSYKGAYTDPVTGIVWYDSPQGVDEDNTYEYVSIATRKTGGSWNAYSNPTIWSHYGEKGQDGDGYEYVYHLSASKDAPTLELYSGKYPDDTTIYDSTKDEWLPSDGDGYWTDDPSAFDQNQPYQFVATRKKKSGVWSKFSQPTIWSNQADKLQYEIEISPSNVTAYWENGVKTYSSNCSTILVVKYFNLERTVLSIYEISSISGSTYVYGDVLDNGTVIGKLKRIINNGEWKSCGSTIWYVDHTDELTRKNISADMTYGSAEILLLGTDDNLLCSTKSVSINTDGVDGNAGCITRVFKKLPKSGNEYRCDIGKNPSALYAGVGYLDYLILQTKENNEISYKAYVCKTTNKATLNVESINDITSYSHKTVASETSANIVWGNTELTDSCWNEVSNVDGSAFFESLTAITAYIETASGGAVLLMDEDNNIVGGMKAPDSSDDIAIWSGGKGTNINDSQNNATFKVYSNGKIVSNNLNSFLNINSIDSYSRISIGNSERFGFLHSSKIDLYPIDPDSVLTIELYFNFDDCDGHTIFGDVDSDGHFISNNNNVAAVTIHNNSRATLYLYLNATNKIRLTSELWPSYSYSKDFIKLRGNESIILLAEATITNTYLEKIVLTPLNTEFCGYSSYYDLSTQDYQKICSVRLNSETILFSGILEKSENSVLYSISNATKNEQYIEQVQCNLPEWYTTDGSAYSSGIMVEAIFKDGAYNCKTDYNKIKIDLLPIESDYSTYVVDHKLKSGAVICTPHLISSSNSSESKKIFNFIFLTQTGLEISSTNYTNLPKKYLLSIRLLN